MRVCATFFLFASSAIFALLKSCLGQTYTSPADSGSRRKHRTSLPPCAAPPERGPLVWFQPSKASSLRFPSASANSELNFAFFFFHFNVSDGLCFAIFPLVAADHNPASPEVATGPVQRLHKSKENSQTPPRKKNDQRVPFLLPSCQQEKKQKPSASLLGLSLLRVARLGCLSPGVLSSCLSTAHSLTHTQAHKLENFLHKIPNQKVNFPTFHATPRASNPARKWPTVAGIVPARKFAQKTSFFPLPRRNVRGVCRVATFFFFF